MQEEKEPKPADSTNDHGTSSETLRDVEENENVSEEPIDKAYSAPLSPDGEMNSDTNERDPKDDVDPM